MMILSSVSSKSLMSCVFAPERTTDSGSPFSSVKTLRFVPIFPQSVGLCPTDSRARGAFIIQPSMLCHSQPIPSNSSYFFKGNRCLPFLKIPVNTAAAPIFLRNSFLLTPGSQNIEDSFQHLSGRQAWPSLSWGFLVMLVRISLLFRNILFDFFSEFV